MKLSNEATLEYMYRYLEKFTGTYRVLAELDSDTNDFPRNEDGSIDESFEDLYIPCKKGVIKHTYKDNDILAICLYDKQPSVAKNLFKEIKGKYKDINIELDLDGNDSYIYFNANDIKKIGTIIKPRTSGASIKWNSNKNLPKVGYEIPEKDLTLLNNLIKDMDRTEKMLFMKNINNEFLESISTKKCNQKEEMKNSRMKAKEYIHSIGKWSKYIKFISDKLEN